MHRNAFLKISTKVVAIIFVLFGAWPVRGQSTSTTLSQLQEDLLQGADAKTFLPAETVLIVFSPPRLVDPNLISADPVVSGHAAFVLADSLPLPRPQFSDSGLDVASVYRAIVNNRAAETQVLNKHQRYQLRRVERVLLKRCYLSKRFFFGGTSERIPSKKLLSYQKYARRYADIETQFLHAKDSRERNRLKKNLANAKIKWEFYGHRKEIEHALKEYENIQNKNPENFWSDVADALRTNSRLVNGSSIPITLLTPAPLRWSDPEDWKVFSGKKSSALLKIVSIKRDWLNIEVVTTHRWKWNDGVYKTEAVVISDGRGFNTGMSGSELMPMLPVSILLAKDAHIGDGETIPGPIVVGIICKVLPPLPTR